MTLEADQIIDRRRMRRKLVFWRVVAFLVVVVAMVVAFGTVGRDSIPELAPDQIARVTISGFISDNRDQTDLLDRLSKTKAVKGVIVAINSGGGATAGGEALYEGLRKLAAAKPTVAEIGTVGASAAYMAAIATDHIVARRTSITGSIGVLFEYPEVSQLLQKLGVTVEDIKSAPLKAEPSPFHPASDEAKAVVAGMIKDTYDWFVDIVAERRGLSRTDALTLADGRIFSGRQALAANLIDEIGGEETAIAWLAAKKNVDAKLPVKDWAPEKRNGNFFFSQADVAALWLARQFGLAPDLSATVLDRILPESLKLDGLQSVWQGPLGGRAQPAEGAPE